jgi:hypothetical protein
LPHRHIVEGRSREVPLVLRALDGWEIQRTDPESTDTAFLTSTVHA